jgi:hypothetical protein
MKVLQFPKHIHVPCAALLTSYSYSYDIPYHHILGFSAVHFLISTRETSGDLSPAGQL